MVLSTPVAASSSLFTFKSLDLVWYIHLNTYFQFLNNITRIFTYFFTYTYFYTCFQTIKHMFLSACTKHPLNLSFNNFNHSEIPVGVRRLSKLTRLDLSHSGFLGKIPSEILQLSKLVSLVLYSNPLKLHKPSLRSIAKKLTNLKEQVLSEVDISSTIPSILSNLSSLKTIFLRDCGLHGEFPTEIFQLPNLKFLNVR